MSNAANVKALPDKKDFKFPLSIKLLHHAQLNKIITPKKQSVQKFNTDNLCADISLIP